MSSHDTPRASVEQSSFLQSMSFDRDKVEAEERHNNHSTRSMDGWIGPRRRWKTPPFWIRPRNILVSLIMIIGLIFFAIAWYRTSEVTVAENIFNTVQVQNAKIEKWDKPKGFKIIGLVFFGRPSVVAVLDCYLKKNLASNGGFLDEVHWVVNTDIPDDIHYLESLVKTTEKYKKVVIPLLGFNSIWEHAVEREHMYIKIDDDMVCLTISCYRNRPSITVMSGLYE